MLRVRWIAGVLACCLAAAGLAACGSSSSSSPLNTELSYLPPNSPLVLTVQTDPNSAAVQNTMAFMGRFPISAIAESMIITRLRQAGVDYDADVKPLFGNPAALAITASSLSQSGGRNFVAVWVTQSAAALNSLIQKASSGLHKAGSRDGAALYQTSGSTTLAVDGATLVLGPNSDAVTSALDRHAGGGGMSPSLYSLSTAGLPSDALIRVFGSLQGLLAASPRASGAARVPWVAAIRGYGVSIGASGSGVTVQYHVDTSGSSLTAAQLPLTPGSGVPMLPAGFPIALGLRDPQHVVGFVLSAERLANPAKYAAYQRRQNSLRAKTGVTQSELLAQLTGNAETASDGHASLGRSDVADPKATSRILARLAKDPRDAYQATSVTRAGALYVFARRSGKLIIGVAGNKVLVGSDSTTSQVRAFATAPDAPASGAHGPLAFSGSLGDLIRLAIQRASRQIPSALLNALGSLTGWASNSPSGLDGAATVAVR